MENNKYKVIYIDYNFIDKRYPNSVKDGDAFYTYGFGSIYARNFKKYNPEVTVECWKADSRINKKYEKTIENVQYRIFPSLRIGSLGHYSKSLLKSLKKEIKKNEKIIINISSFRHLLFYTVAAKLKNVPLVVQHHGEASAIYKTKINKGIKKLFYLLQVPVENFFFRNIDILFVLDERIKEYLPGGNKNMIVEVSTTGVDEEVFYPIDKIEAKKQLGWDINKKHVLYVGRLNYTKRPDILIDIYREYKHEARNDIVLVFAGAEKEDPLYDRAKQAGIKIYPKILMTELYKYLSAADVYVLPHLSEQIPFGGIGMLTVQALFCNTPIVGSTVSAFPKSDIDKVGIPTFNKDQLKKSIKEIIKRGNSCDLRVIAKKYYTWKNISEKTKSYYMKLLENQVRMA